MSCARARAGKLIVMVIIPPKGRRNRSVRKHPWLEVMGVMWSGKCAQICWDATHDRNVGDDGMKNQPAASENSQGADWC
jgi:hypothetical protein